MLDGTIRFRVEVWDASTAVYSTSCVVGDGFEGGLVWCDWVMDCSSRHGLSVSLWFVFLLVFLFLTEFGRGIPSKGLTSMYWCKEVRFVSFGVSFDGEVSS